MILTQENYFSKEADLEYMSVSQFKAFEKCEAEALAINKEKAPATFKEAYLEGHLFEELVAGDSKLFIAQHHDELIAKTGKTAGELKANFKKILNSAEKFNSQEFLRNIIDKSEKQVILTGEIEGVKVKCCLDLFDKENKMIYDIKCMSNFIEQWDKKAKCYKPWYYSYDYVLQLAVYREIVKQNFGIDCTTALIAASKEDVPDLQALKFSNELLDEELQYFKSKVKYYDEIKKGLRVPTSCDCCDYCKSIKQIDKFTEIF